MEIKKLFYLTDTESPSFEEVAQLMVFRKLGLEEVIFLNPSGIEDWEKRLEGYGLKAKILAGESPVLPTILDSARREAVSMIAASLNKGTKKMFGGSRIKYLLRSSPVPVIVLKEDAQTKASEKKGIFHHVIYATDWSPLSETVLDYLLSLKKIIEVVEIVNVIHRKLSVREMRNLKQRLVETRQIFLDEGIDAEAHVYAGKPSDEIMLAARDYGATSIIMGTSRKSLVREIFSGSCSYRVAEEVEIPVMVVGEQEKWSNGVLE